LLNLFESNNPKIQWDKDVRRVTVDQTTTFQDLQQTLRSIFKAVPDKRWKITVVKYQDDEGDLCTITTDEELQEAISLCISGAQASRPLLRLILVTKVKVAQPVREQQPTQQSQSELLARLAQQIHQFQIQQIAQNLPQLQQQQQTETQSTSEAPAPAPIRFGFGCHGAGRGHLGGRFHQLRTKSQQLHEQGIQLMDAKDYSGARVVFQQQLEILRRPWHRATPLYNIACCDALEGNTSSALSNLEQAIASGFTDAEHLIADEDFESLRGTEEFNALVAKARAAIPHPFHGIRHPHQQPQQQQPQQASRQEEWFDLQQKALNLMTVGTVDAICSARELLSRQASLSTHAFHQRIPLYNIACCDALLGRTEEAFTHLKEAIAAGYRNLKHMETDEDLKSLRETEEWQTVINGLKSGHHACRGWWRRFRGEEVQAEQPEEPQAESPVVAEEPVAVVQEEQVVVVEEQVAVEEEQPVAVEEPKAEENVVVSEYAQALDVLVAMGFTVLEDNLAALSRVGGDIGRALDMLI